MTDVETGGPEVHRAPGVRRDDDGSRRSPAAARIASTLRARTAADSSGCSTAYAPPAPQHKPSSAVSTRRYAARAPPGRRVRLLDVAKVTRVLHDHASHPVRAARSDGLLASHSEKSRTRAERLGLGRPEQAAVVLHRRAATRAVDDDRRVAGHRRDRRAGEPPRLVDPAGVHVQRAAAVAAAARELSRAGGAHHASTRRGARRAARRPSRSR